MTPRRSFLSLISDGPGAPPQLVFLALVASLALVTGACASTTTTDAANKITTNVGAQSVDPVSTGDNATAAPSPQATPTSMADDDPAPEGAVAETNTEVRITVSDGTASGDTGRHDISVGEVISIVVSADVADHVHVHGYDLTAPVGPDEDATIMFATDVPGVFEVELEEAGLPLTELLVR